MSEDKSIALGHPSYVWRFGQDRRLAMIDRCAPLEGRRILDVGCGLGMYLRQFHRLTEQAYGVDVDAEKLVEAGRELPHLSTAQAEALPFPDNTFDVLLLHEVLEHVGDDGAAVREAVRVLTPGGRIVIFAPNRLYPLETHGVYLGRRYVFGNVPLVNWLPDPLRRRFAPHVRAYRARDLQRLLDGLPCRVVVHTQIYPGYDKIAHRWPWLATLLRRMTYFLEATPLRSFGLSHFMVVDKTTGP